LLCSPHRPSKAVALYYGAHYGLINVSKTLEFFLPPTLLADTPYCIVLKTNSTKGNTTKKSYSVSSSSIVKLKDE
ncbi:MAG: hypothetical protein II077_17360, partial [Treponema sp.]|nr:hypothetical protein [Treponema sp.]